MPVTGWGQSGGSVNGIAFRTAGTGPAVVLLHAGVADCRMWDDVTAVLASSYTVVQYDLRGFGASPPPAAAFRHLDDLVAVLDHLGIARAAVVGNSLGGKLALDLAWARPDRVDRLAMLASPLGGWDWSAPMRRYAEAEEAALRAGDIDEALRINLDMWVRGPARDWTPSLREIAARVSPAMRVALTNQLATEEWELDDPFPPVEEHLPDVAVPALVGVGDQDLPDFGAIAELLGARIPGARSVRFPGAGHLIPMEQPEPVTAHLGRFLAA